jgi:hypothetical protein
MAVAQADAFRSHPTNLGKSLLGRIRRRRGHTWERVNCRAHGAGITRAGDGFNR